MRKFYLGLLFVYSFSSLFAGNIDLQTARQVATGFIKSCKPTENVSVLLASSDYTISMKGTNVYYIINLDPKGFIIVPAYDAAPPVLGYSLENNYSSENQPENFSQWMDEYAHIISDLIEKNIASTKGNSEHWLALINPAMNKSASTVVTVGPLLPSLWNQSYPYNYLCPVDGTGSGGHVYSGCVATAMAQVMYYWRYPQHGTGSHGYTWDPYGYLFADFGNTTYKWEEMENATSSQNFEMAQLQLHLGISVNMMYSGSGSGAYSQDAANSLRNYFGYDQSLELKNRDDYSYSNWKNLLHAQIDAGQPMYYHGFGTGGHAFNVDGYQDTLFFHFNWGWSGSYNGYFHLFNLNPGGNSFTNGQGAIINFIPPANYSTQCGLTDTLTNLSGSIEDGSGPVSPYFNNSACSWLILPNDTLDNIKLTFNRFDLEDGKDFLYIYDGTDNDAPLIGSYTGSTLPPIVTSTSGAMYIHFVTNGNGVSNGWFASYNAKQAVFCSSNTTVLTAPSGSLSDGSGSFDYRDRTVCKFKLLPTNAKSISITFNEFNTAGEDDVLKIYDLDTQALLYTLYGQSNPGTLNFNTGKLYLVFLTDQENTASGWNFSYSSSEVTSSKSYDKNLNVSIFPNPASNQLQLSINGLDNTYKVKLASTDGIVIMEQNLMTESGNVTSKIDISGLARGIYVLQISCKKGSIYKKVILN